MSKYIPIYLCEYEKLKEEQISRINKRDGLIYLTLAMYGTIFSFSLVNDGYLYILLFLPIVSFILAWIYVINDEKISHIGSYIRNVLSKNIIKEVDTVENREIFGWEIYHRTDSLRKFRKFTQFSVEQITFFIFPFSSIIFFLIYNSSFNFPILILVSIDVFISLSLSTLIIFHEYNNSQS